jgi:hypothetical protein
MAKYITLFFVLFLFAYTGCGPKINYKTPPDSEINNIAEAVVSQEDLPILKRPGGVTIGYRLSKELRKIQIIDKDKADAVLPPLDFNKIYFYNLIPSKYFEANDRDFLLFQNSILPTFILSKNLQNKLNITTFEEQADNKKAGKSIAFYDLSVPIFSADLTTAFVEVTFNCPGLCGEVTGLFLKRVDGKWFIVGSEKLAGS